MKKTKKDIAFKKDIGINSLYLKKYGKKTIKDYVQTAITTLIITVIGGFILAYLTSSEPVFYLQDLNNYGFDKDKGGTLI